MSWWVLFRLWCDTIKMFQRFLKFYSETHWCVTYRYASVRFISHLGWLVILSKWNLHLFLDPTLSRIIFFLSRWVLFGSWCDIIKMFQRLVLSETTAVWLIVACQYGLIPFWDDPFKVQFLNAILIRRLVGSFFITSTLHITLWYNKNVSEVKFCSETNTAQHIVTMSVWSTYPIWGSILSK